MTDREKAIGELKFMLEQMPKEPPLECDYIDEWLDTDREKRNALDMAIKTLECEPCEMTVEEYRQRMIQAFHNADCDELIAICALPTEKEFEHLEWLLKNHYKKKGHWISGHKETGALGITYTEKICSNCGWNHSLVIPKNYCPNCGAKMTESEEV